MVNSRDDRTPDSETEERILDAAHAVFLRRGTAGARMQEIADEAGVNKALLHYYFRSKAGLAEAVFRRAAQRLFPPMIALMTSEAGLEEKVRRFIEHELRVLSDTPDLPGYVVSEMHHNPGRFEAVVEDFAGLAPREFGPRILARLEEQIADRVEAGMMRPIAPEQFMANLVSLCIFPFAARPLLTLVVGGGAAGFDAFIEERARTLADFFLRGLRP